MRFSDRTTSDILVLMIAGTICASVFGATVFLILSDLLNPDDDHVGAAALVSDTIQMLVSLLAGFIAGRTDSQMAQRRGSSKAESDEVP